MDSPVSIDSILEELNAPEKAPSLYWGVLALQRQESGWVLRYAEIVAGFRPPAARPRVWDASEHVLFERALTARQVRALVQGHGCTVAKFKIRPISRQTSVRGDWLPSNRVYGGVRLAWPATRYECDPATTDHSSDHVSGMFVNQTGPSFSTYQSAIRMFFSRNVTDPWMPRVNTLTLYVADAGARIRHVTLGKGHVTVDVDGPAIADCSLQFSTGDHHERMVLAGPGKVQFTLPGELDDETLVLLTDDGVRDVRSVSAFGYHENDDTVTWDEPELQIEGLLYSGESSRVEFKQEMPATAAMRRKVLKVVPAFANGLGGVLLVGVDDDGAVVGLGDLTASAVRDRLERMVHDSVVPVPPFSIDCVEVRGQLVGVVSVAPGTAQPYALNGNPPQFFARHGSSTFPATREEIIAWAAPPANNTYGLQR